MSSGTRKVSSRSSRPKEVGYYDPIHIHDIFLRWYASADNGNWYGMTEEMFFYIKGHLSGCGKCKRRYSSKFLTLKRLDSLASLLKGFLGEYPGRI